MLRFSPDLTFDPTGSHTAVLDQYMPPINVTIHFQSDGTSDIEITFPVS